MKTVTEFLEEHRLRASVNDIGNLVRIFMEDMSDGLRGKEGALRMIPTYIEAENDFHKDIPVLAIDAGGTNFRASLISFTSSGRTENSEIINYRMPGLDREISAVEFFSTIAGYVRPLAESAGRIGFCFSYPTEILPGKDGRLIQFCKEVRAPEVVGRLIGKGLLEALGTPEKHIVIINDTVATLLAGKSVSLDVPYDSYIGYILGTGTNSCYIEQNSNILKNRDQDQSGSQIINIESGNFNKAPRSDLDIIFDNTTVDPGSYTFEKMFSGGYFGGLCLSVLKAASGEGVFSTRTAQMLESLKELSSNDANSFAADPRPDLNVLKDCLADERDAENCRRIIDSLIDRAAALVTANLAAVVLKTGKGKSSEHPLLITVEGTSFYKMHNLKARFENYFYNYLSGNMKRNVEFTTVARSGLIGAALAALID